MRVFFVVVVVLLLLRSRICYSVSRSSSSKSSPLFQRCDLYSECVDLAGIYVALAILTGWGHKWST